MGVRLPPFASSRSRCASGRLRHARLRHEPVGTASHRPIDEDRIRRRQRDPQEPRRRDPEHRRRRRDRQGRTRLQQAPRGSRASGPARCRARVVKQRFRDQILHDVAHELIPRAVDEALRERGVEPVDTPDIRDVVVEEGQPLKFTATFETVPPFEPRRLRADRCRRTPTPPWTRRRRAGARSGCASAPRATSRSRAGARRRTAITRRCVRPASARRRASETRRSPRERVSRHRRHGQSAGIRRAAARPRRPARPGRFTIHYPADYAVKELAGTTVALHRHREGAEARASCRRSTTSSRRTSGEFETLDALRARVRAGPRARGASTRPSATYARRPAEAARRARHLRRARRRWSSARSIAGSRSSSAG